MCLAGSPSLPAAPLPAAKDTDPAVTAALERERQRQAAAGGRKSTILTTGSGLSTPSAPSGLRTVIGG